jgi:sulfonate transport system substrate-binding protein
MTLTRRSLLGGLGALAGCARLGPQTLLVGDQRGGQKGVLEAIHALGDTPYRITWSNFPNAAPLLQALDAGAIDTGYGGDAAFVFAAGSGAHIRAIGALRSRGSGPVLVVRSDSPVRDMRQIKGLHIATPRGSISHNYILAALERIGLPYDAITFAFLSPQDGEAALRGGSVDGWAIWDPNAALSVRRGGVRVVGGGEGLVPSCSLQFASQAALDTKRALLDDYHRRLYRGWAWAADHIDAYAALLAQETGLDAPLWRQVLARRRSVPVPIDAGVIAEQQATADRYHRAGLIARPFDITPAFDTSFSKDPA